MRAGIWRWQSSRAPSFADAFAATLGEETRPQRRGILYTDEVIGGNILSAQKKKKKKKKRNTFYLGFHHILDFAATSSRSNVVSRRVTELPAGFVNIAEVDSSGVKCTSPTACWQTQWVCRRLRCLTLYFSNGLASWEMALSLAKFEEAVPGCPASPWAQYVRLWVGTHRARTRCGRGSQTSSGTKNSSREWPRKRVRHLRYTIPRRGVCLGQHGYGHRRAPIPAVLAAPRPQRPKH